MKYSYAYKLGDGTRQEDAMEAENDGIELLDINEKFEDEQSEKFWLYLRETIYKQKSAPPGDLVDIPVPGECLVKYYRKYGFDKESLSVEDFALFAISLYNAYFYYPIDRTETFLADMIKEYCDKGEDENGNVTDRELIPHLIYENAKFARRIIKYMAYFRGECEWLEGSETFADVLASDMKHFIEEFSLVCEVFGSYAMREKYTRQLRRTTAPIEIVLEEIRKIFPSEELERFKDKLWFFTYAFLYHDTMEKGRFDLTKERVDALRDAADALVKNIETNEREFNLKRNQERFARAMMRDSELGGAGLVPKVEDLTRMVKEGFGVVKGEFATAHKEHQKIDKEVVGVRRGLGAVLRHIKDWKNIVREMLSKRKIPWGGVDKAVGEDRYAKVDWSKIKHKDGIRQIKDVIDYTYDVKPVTLGVSKKNLKSVGGITLGDACCQTAILHKEEWAKFTDPYPTAKGLYVACHDLATRKREENPFRVA